MVARADGRGLRQACAEEGGLAIVAVFHDGFGEEHIVEVGADEHVGACAAPGGARLGAGEPVSS